MEVLDYQQRGLTGDIWTGQYGSVLELSKPKEAYQSPLQRIGLALKMPPSRGQNTATNPPPPLVRLDTNKSIDSRKPSREPPNYSYKLPPGRTSSPTRPRTENRLDLAMDKGSRTSVDTGSIISPTTRAEQRNKGFFLGIGLLSSFFSNPRTRAPFKPQKANRGTSSWQLKQYAEATLGSGSLRKAVKLPEGEDKDEWLAVNGKVYA